MFTAGLTRVFKLLSDDSKSKCCVSRSDVVKYFVVENFDIGILAMVITYFEKFLQVYLNLLAGNFLKA